MEDKYIKCYQTIENLYSVFGLQWFKVCDITKLSKETESEVSDMLDELVKLGFLLRKGVKFRLSSNKVNLLWELSKHLH